MSESKPRCALIARGEKRGSARASFVATDGEVLPAALTRRQVGPATIRSAVRISGSVRVELA